MFSRSPETSLHCPYTALSLIERRTVSTIPCDVCREMLPYAISHLRLLTSADDPTRSYSLHVCVYASRWNDRLPTLRIGCGYACVVLCRGVSSKFCTIFRSRIHQSSTTLRRTQEELCFTSFRGTAVTADCPVTQQQKLISTRLHWIFLLCKAHYLCRYTFPTYRSVYAHMVDPPFAADAF